MTTKTYKNITIILLILLTLPSFISAPPKSKCSGDLEYSKGLKALGNYRIIKDYRVSLSSGDEKNPKDIGFPISLTSGLEYQFIIENNPENKNNMVMNIYINNKKQMLIATSYNSSLKKHYKSVKFKCQTSGTFYMYFSFDDYKKGCGVGLFSVIKK